MEKEKRGEWPREERTVLVVDDNEMERELLCDLLAGEYRILQAEDGLAGLRMLERGERIDLVLLDVFMPNCDGFEFLERKRRNPELDAVPVIMMTASNTVNDEVRCLELGATDFITKPYNQEVMRNRMKSVIRLRESAAMLNRLEKDSQTGLYSKEFFYHNMARILKAEPDERFDLVCSDIENFRAMNERYGSAYCDEVLRTQAGRISGLLPGLLFGGRIGADVFAFLIRHNETDWTGVLDADSQGGASERLSMKYSVFADVDRSLEPAAICDRATLVLNRIKHRFGTNVAWYDDEMRRLQMREHQIEDSMLRALEEHEFIVYYQPKHELHTDRTGGAEALVRWVSPQLGFVGPGDFIPIFERNGFITRLDFYVWEEVCRHMQQSREKGLPVVPVSVNVSRRDFEVDDLAERIIAMVDRYGIEHSMLHIELTETVYGDNPGKTASTLKALHDAGFIIELDDFGTGYSNMTSLSTLDIDVMKLDMGLIRQASTTNDYSVLRVAVLMAEVLRLTTVVEGVETEAEVAAVRVMGCDYVQGYYYSKPLPTEQWDKYLLETT